MYIFSAKATGPGGTSDYGVSAPAIYTTPTALGMLEAVKAEAAKVVRPTGARHGLMRT